MDNPISNEEQTTPLKTTFSKVGSDGDYRAKTNKLSDEQLRNLAKSRASFGSFPSSSSPSNIGNASASGSIFGDLSANRAVKTNKPSCQVWKENRQTATRNLELSSDMFKNNVEAHTFAFMYTSQDNANEDILSVVIENEGIFELESKPGQKTFIQFMSNDKSSGTDSKLGTQSFIEKVKVIDFGFKIPSLENLMEVMFGRENLQVTKVFEAADSILPGSSTNKDVKIFIRTLFNRVYGYELTFSNPTGAVKKNPKEPFPKVNMHIFPLEKEKLDLISKAVKIKYSNLIHGDDKIIIGNQQQKVRSLVLNVLRSEALKKRSHVLQFLKSKALAMNTNVIGFNPIKNCNLSSSDKNKKRKVSKATSSHNVTVSPSQQYPEVQSLGSNFQLQTENSFSFHDGSEEVDDEVLPGLPVSDTRRPNILNMIEDRSSFESGDSSPVLPSNGKRNKATSNDLKKKKRKKKRRKVSTRDGSSDSSSSSSRDSDLDSNSSERGEKMKLELNGFTCPKCKYWSPDLLASKGHLCRGISYSNSYDSQTNDGRQIGNNSGKPRIDKSSSYLQVGQDSTKHQMGQDSTRLHMRQDSTRHHMVPDSTRLQMGLDSRRLQKGHDSTRLQKGHDSSRLQKGHDSTRPQKGQDSTRLHMGQDSTRLHMGQDSTRLHMRQDSTRHHMGLDSTRLHKGQDSTRLQLGPDSRLQVNHDTSELEMSQYSLKPQVRQNSSEVEMGHYSIKPQMRQNSSEVKMDHYSVKSQVRQNSPELEMGQFSVKPQVRQNSPEHEMGQFSVKPQVCQNLSELEMGQYSVKPQVRQNSPELEMGQFSVKPQVRQNSSQLEMGQYSVKPQVRQNSPELHMDQFSVKPQVHQNSSELQMGQYSEKPLMGRISSKLHKVVDSAYTPSDHISGNFQRSLDYRKLQLDSAKLHKAPELKRSQHSTELQKNLDSAIYNGQLPAKLQMGQHSTKLQMGLDSAIQPHENQLNFSVPLSFTDPPLGKVDQNTAFGPPFAMGPLFDLGYLENSGDSLIYSDENLHIQVGNEFEIPFINTGEEINHSLDIGGEVVISNTNDENLEKQGYFVRSH